MGIIEWEIKIVTGLFTDIIVKELLWLSRKCCTSGALELGSTLGNFFLNEGAPSLVGAVEMLQLATSDEALDVAQRVHHISN